MVVSGRELRPPVSPQIAKVYGVDRNLHRIQQNIDAATKAARANPENRGRLVEKVNIPAAGDITVSHKLGRKPRGFTERKIISGAPIYTEKFSTSRILVLTGTSAGVIDLWVF